MLTATKHISQVIHYEQDDQETSQQNHCNQYKINISDNKISHNQNHQQNFKSKIKRNLISLESKDQVESVNSAKSDDMDIDEENDIVNQLSYIQELQKTNQQDQMFANLSAKQRILYANTKKHQGNQHFRQNNLEQAIQAYKFGLSLLKPESFISASSSDCLSMAELTSNILYNMGTCYFILMSFRYAIKFYDQAILIKPNYVKAIHNRALCHLEGGNLLTAYDDIKLAYNYDKNNVSIQNDLKKIQEQYYSAYRHQGIDKPDSFLQLQDKKIMSKSMMQNNFLDFLRQQQPNDTSNSMIGDDQSIRNNVQISRLSEQKNSNKSLKQQSNGINNSRQKIKSFYGKRFYRNQLQKPSKLVINKPSSSNIMNSPKFRPYIFNKSPHSGNKSPNILQPVKKQKQNLQSSVGQIFERQKRINLFQNKIQENQQINVKEIQQTPKKKRSISKQKNKKNTQDNLWGYIPIVAAAGFGLYHSLRAVLGK